MNKGWRLGTITIGNLRRSIFRLLSKRIPTTVLIETTWRMRIDKLNLKTNVRLGKRPTGLSDNVDKLKRTSASVLNVMLHPLKGLAKTQTTSRGWIPPTLRRDHYLPPPVHGVDNWRSKLPGTCRPFAALDSRAARRTLQSGNV